jgi:phosphoribosylaminoimidazole carboxylase/phosphoribosylaminoimidazole-succinocarboxamide synthase
LEDVLEKSGKLTEGKTKIVWGAKGNSIVVIMENKNDITALDDPDKTRQFATKAISATTTTCRVFELLKQAGIPVAYAKQLSATEFLAPKCQMIPLEVVARRYAFGSYLKRHPELFKPEGALPHRFDQLVVEFFLKTTGGRLVSKDGRILVDGLDPKAGEEDPFIINPFEAEWGLYHSKKPAWDPDAFLKRTVMASDVVARLELMTQMADITKRTFLVLEGAWAMLGYRLIDFKIEFGIGPDGRLYVADVIDNDSWRLRDADWKELSKQLFRDGESLTVVEDMYALVAVLTERFHVPRQALVLWRGSPNDNLPKVDKEALQQIGVEVVDEIAKSGHKATRHSLDKLSHLATEYPEGGAIIALVGRSNGLGPTLAAHTTWPVISVPLTMKEFPDDVWSSLRMPSQVPMATVWPVDEAVLYALNILAQRNPLVYARQQKTMEELEQ